MTNHQMTIEVLHRVKALKQLGFDVVVTSDADGVIVRIRKKAATGSPTS